MILPNRSGNERLLLASPIASENRIEEQSPLLTIVEAIRREADINFGEYKSNYFERRVKRRMSLQRLDQISDYCRLIDASSAERRQLLRDLTINVTDFFRDGRPFRILRERIFPEMLAALPTRSEGFRVWSAGCSTGEEPYSIAMLLCDILEESGDLDRVKIFATDIGKEALDTARGGTYHVSRLGALSSPCDKRYFIEQGESRRVNEGIREMVCFGYHDLTVHPPISHLDAIVCRNVLIYLNRECQKRIFDAFAYALRPGGCLVLGKSEIVPSDLRDIFFEIDRKARIYRKRTER